MVLGAGVKASERKKRASEGSFASHVCISSPEPGAALVLTRSAGDRVLLLERGARAAGTRRRGGPRAAAAGAESHHLSFPQRLRVWDGGAAEGAWGGGEEEQHLLLLLPSSETSLQRRPRPPAGPGAHAQPLRPPVLCAPPRAWPSAPGAGQLSSCCWLSALARWPRRPGELGCAARPHDGPWGPRSQRVPLAGAAAGAVCLHDSSSCCGGGRAGPAPALSLSATPGS